MTSIDPAPAASQLVVLGELEGRDWAGGRNPVQDFLAPAADTIVIGWSVVWTAVLAVMLYHAVIRPLLARRRRRDAP